MTFSNVASAALIAAAGAVAGCQSYRSQPLDLGAHREAFLARTPGAPEVEQLAQSLSDEVPAAGERAGFDASDGLSAAEAELVALVFNGELRIARARAGVTLAGSEHAGLWDDPTIGTDITRILESTTHPWKVFTSIGLTLPVSGRLEVEKARAGVAHAAELARVAEREWLVRMEVRRVWVQWAAIGAQIEAQQGLLGRIDDVVSVVDAMERFGELSRTEARLFRVERAGAAAELTLLESRLEQSTLALKRLMGLPPSAEVLLSGTGLIPMPDTVPVAGVSGEMEHELILGSPLLLATLAEYELAERTLELEVRKQYPDLQIGPGYGSEDGQNQLLLGLSVPIPILNANRGGIAEAEAAREVARAIAETSVEQLMDELAVAVLQLRTAAVQRQVLESEIVPLVEAQYEDVREIARLGELNAVVMLDSLKRQQEIKSRLIEARRDEALAAIRWREIVGPGPTTGEGVTP